jgi:RNA polymerase sigma-70 factor (ECF subfamily)
VGTFGTSSIHLGTIAHGILESSRAESSERARPISELDDIDGLVKRYRARLLRFATYATGDVDLAESITQDTLLRAYNGRDKFRGECSVNTWLTGIAVNVIRDHQRTMRYKFWKRVKSNALDINEMASFIAVEGLNPEGQMLATEQVKHLAAVLETLSHNQRTIFLLKFSEEMSVDEICTTLGMTNATVRTHLHRALKAVRGQLGAET